mgnify:CR=1 FL=1
MKKRLLTLVVFATTLIACEDNTQDITEKEYQNERREVSANAKIDPIKDCPQNDRNCNGVPDSEE